ncbi:MAG: ERCC4 domain-containing protein [Acidilobaceae archaeon]
MEKKVRVYADYREEPSGIPSLLEAAGLIVFRKQLEIGDYVLPGGVAVERKTVADFASSLFDGRLFEQASRLSDSYDVVVYIVEGDPRDFRLFHNKLKQIHSALAALVLSFDARILFSSSPRESASLIEALARKSAEERGGGRAVIHKKPRLSTLREWQLYVVSSLPGIGPRLAEKLLEQFKTVENVFTASLAELQRVVGESRAERIKALLKTPYERREKRAQDLSEFLESP